MKASANIREPVFVMALLLGIILLNLTTAMAYPKVWSDEAMYSDPAANWALGKGFVSGSWYVQTSDKFWAGNSPLHEMILGEWIRAFGFTPIAVRSINYVWFGLGTFLVWLACFRGRWIENTRLRLLLILLLACDMGISFSYRSGRPDMIGYFFCSAALAATTLRSTPTRYAVLFCLGIFFPWAGIQLLPLLTIVTGLVFIFFGWPAALSGICTGLGAGAGLFTLYWFFQAHGVWTDFVASVKWHASGPQSLVYRHAQIGALPEVFTRDHSAPFMLLSFLALAGYAWKARNQPALRIVLFALAAGVGIPVSLHFIGVFPIYYGWMAALPVSLALCHALTLQPVLVPWIKGFMTFLLIGAMLIGLPSHLAIVALAGNELPYSAADQFISAHLRESDRVYIDYSAFYPAMRSAKKVFTLRYFPNAMTADEKKSVNVLVISPAEASMTNTLPGNWRLDGNYDGAATRSSLPTFLSRHLRASGAYTPYQYVIYRRDIENHPQP